MSDDLVERYRRHGDEHWKTWGSDSEHFRYSEAIDPRSRRRCPCCKRRSTHRGMANGIALISGCELQIARWVRNPRDAIAAAARKR